MLVFDKDKLVDLIVMDYEYIVTENISQSEEFGAILIRPFFSLISAVRFIQKKVPGISLREQDKFVIYNLESDYVEEMANGVFAMEFFIAQEN